MFWRKKSYFDNSAPDIKNRRKQPCQVRYMAPIEQFFVTLNVATPDLFARFDKRKDRQKLRQAINPSAGMLRSGLKIGHDALCLFFVYVFFFFFSIALFVVVVICKLVDIITVILISYVSVWYIKCLNMYSMFCAKFISVKLVMETCVYIMNLIFTGWSPHMCEESCHLKSFSV